LSCAAFKQSRKGRRNAVVECAVSRLHGVVSFMTERVDASQIANRLLHTRRRDIEGLRAIAVSAVVFFHLHIPGFSGGFVGVDIFFVISGFLITSLLLREAAEHGRINLLSFWMRRARRLLPNAFLVLAFVLLANFWLVPAYRWGEIAPDVFAALAFYANFHFSSKAVDYFFVNGTPSSVLHFW
jgi:peptidoglycan/LPS O-acetylase OafA/YrhL